MTALEAADRRRSAWRELVRDVITVSAVFAVVVLTVLMLLAAFVHVVSGIECRSIEEAGGPPTRGGALGVCLVYVNDEWVTREAWEARDAR